MNQYVIDNAEWVNRYDNTIEIKKISSLINKLGFSRQDEINIADVGCGSGRSTKWIKSILHNSTIDAIDLNHDCIEYAKDLHGEDANFISADAFDYFKYQIGDKKKYNLIFFVWSLFDMVDGLNRESKSMRLDMLLTSVKNALAENGYVIVLQPTKGGIFEKILSLFMPESDDDYLFTHEYLISKNFFGSKNPFPLLEDENAIWSNFTCNREKLFRGVSSILMLETHQSLTLERFNKVLNDFGLLQDIFNGDTLYLSDCVNIYHFPR